MIPEPPSVTGIISAEPSSSSRFFRALFKFYNAITPTLPNRMNNIRREISAIKNIQATSGISIDYSRNVSKHMQIKHGLLLAGSDTEEPSYTNLIQYDSDFMQLRSHLWGSFALVTQCAPSLGALKSHVVGSFVLTEDADEPLPKQPNALTINLGLNSVGDWEKMDKSPLLDQVNISFDMPGSSLSLITDCFRDSFQISMMQQLSRRHYSNLTYFVNPSQPSQTGLALQHRYEAGNQRKYPRNVYTFTGGINSHLQPSHLGISYTRHFNEHFQWSSELEYGKELEACTGFDYHFRHFNVEASTKCLLTSKGELVCSWVNPLSGGLSCNFTARSDLPNSDFSFGIGIALNH